MNVNATNLSDTIKTLYERRLLTRALPRLIHGKYLTPARLNQFGSYELRKWSGYAAVTTALSESVTPSEQAAPSISTTTLTPSWYGSWVGFGDKAIETSMDPVVTELTAILGEQAGLSIDTLCRNALISGATADYAGAATSTATIDNTNDKITFSDFISQVANLEVQNAMPVDGNDFAVYIHPYTWQTLMQDSTFVTMFTREGGTVYRNGLIGSVLRCKIFVSSNAYSQASTVTVYSALFLAREAAGVAGIGSLVPQLTSGDIGSEYANMTGQAVRPIEVIVKQPGSAGSLDPLNQRGSVGWKMTHDLEILNSNWIRQLEHAVVS